MKTIQRYYFYIVSVVSLEVTVWASIWLLRSVFPSNEVLGGANILASALSYIFVAVPVFLIHWNWVRKDILENVNQRIGGIRAFFLHLTSLVLWVPIIQNVLAIALRLINVMIGNQGHGSFFGSNQSWSDNIAAIFVNLIFVLYVQKVLKEDSESDTYEIVAEYFRKIWWYLLALYPLLLTYFGLEKIVFYILNSNMSVTRNTNGLVNGLGLILVGLPLWVVIWSKLNKRFKASDQPVIVRQIILAAKHFSLLMVMFTSTTTLISKLTNRLFEVPNNGDFNSSISYLIPALLFWLYFNQFIKEESEDWNNLIKQINLRLITLISLVTAFFGLAIGGWNLIELIFNPYDKGMDYMKSDIIQSFSMMLVWGLVWWVYWKTEIKKDDDKQILIERIYQYLVVGAAVIGGMFTAANFLYVIIRAILEGAGKDFTYDILSSLYLLALFTIALVYHLRFLRKIPKKDDKKVVEKAIDVISFEPYEGFSDLVLKLLASENKTNIKLHVVNKRMPSKKIAVSLIFIGSSQLSELTKAQEKYFADFEGNVVVIPEEKNNWHFMGSGEAASPVVNSNILGFINDSAAGEKLVPTQRRSIWEVFGYLFAVFAGVGFLCVLANILMEAARMF